MNTPPRLSLQHLPLWKLEMLRAEAARKEERTRELHRQAARDLERIDAEIKLIRGDQVQRMKARVHG